MAKDKMLQQQNWEKKKEKMDRKKQTERGSCRAVEKVDKKDQKKLVEARQKELREVRISSAALRKIHMVQAGAFVIIFASYIVAMSFDMKASDHVAFVESKAGDGESNASRHGRLFTAVAVVALTTVVAIGSFSKRRLIRLEEQREAANLIKGSLDRKQTEKERATRMKERQVLQQKQARERQQRRAEEDAKAFQQAKELAVALKRRREERQAVEEAEARAVGKTSAIDEHENDVERDTHGWSARQRQQLREALLKYPEGWSHSRKKRWDMIALEVPGQDARSCEAAISRIEASHVKVVGQKETKSDAAGGRPSAKRWDDDMDWLGEDDDGTTTVGELGAPGAGDSDDGDEEEEEDEGQERMAVEVEPERKGTEIRLENLKAMQGCATVQVEVLHLQIACADCRATTCVYLSGADEDGADAKTWCDGCAELLSIRLRPTLLHRASSRLCYVDCVRCNVVDMLPSVLTTVCEGCDAINVHKSEFTRNKLIHGTCTTCHEKFTFGAESIRIDQITPCEPGHSSRNSKRTKGSSSGDADDDPMSEIAEELRWLRKKAKADPRQQLIKLGSQLPRMGACSHFKKSFKWYRFACCGRAFPCPQCHMESNCPAAGLGAHANRMICGKCSMEQRYDPASLCEKCGFTMGAISSSHWQDGCGTRNIAIMSTKDAKKFKGGNKQANSKAKTSSSKSDRVGAKAKAKREHVKKFGKDGS
eukprot:TRINITY_DN18575_c1_g1_i2.p1 TRINITY_DN18575_c1_g1~~TRINITY_DN18575_c1_g1_i2.p1  ORF type:complete len:709 (-),score=163.15 TRINITY_DN18575_c1_g1_i2:256-2382(-)